MKKFLKGLGIAAASGALSAVGTDHPDLTTLGPKILASATLGVVAFLMNPNKQ